jgi:uncharacterized membrane protein
MIAALIIAVVLIVGITLIYKLDEEKDFAVVVMLGLVALVVIGMVIGEYFPKSSKKKITPKVKVECENNKCDTTYIYN